MKRLAAAAPVVFFFAAVAALGCFRLVDADLWLYLRVGEGICRSGRVPRADVFSYSAAGRPWVDVHWLAQAALWLAYRAGGAEGLSVLRLALVAAIFAVLYRCCRRSAPPALACGVLALALVAAGDGFLMKPQLFALLLAAAFVSALERPGRAPWLLVPLQLLWVNLHPSFFLGPALVLVYWADARVKGGGRGGASGPLLAACALACLATPYGPAVLLQPWRQVGTRLYAETVIPWLPPSSAFPAPASFLYFRIMLAITAVSFALNARNARPAHLAVAAAFAVLSLRSRRHIPLFAVLSAPGLAYNLGRAAEAFRARAPGAARALGAAYTVLLCAFLAFLVRDAATGEFYFRQRSLKRFGVGVSSIAYPDAAMDFLAAARAPGRVFCNYDIASYVAGRPGRSFPVFIDGRNLVYGEGLLRRYLDAMGDPASLDSLAEEYGVDALLFSHASRDVKAILRPLWESARWRPAYADDRSVVFLKAGRRPEIPRLDLASCALPGVPSRGAFPLAELRAGEFFFNVGERACARARFREALERRADLPEARNFLGVIAAQEGDMAGAAKEFAAASALSRSYAEPRANLSGILRGLGDAEGAVREAAGALRIAPSNPHAREALGLALMARGDLRGAREELENALRLSPSAERHSNLGVLLERAGETEGAAAEYEKARRLSPGHFAPRFNLALLRQKAGDDEAAIALYEEALAIDPGNGPARRNLEALLARRSAAGGAEKR